MSDTDPEGVFAYLESRHALKQSLAGESDQPVKEAAENWFKAIRERVEATRQG